MSGDDERVVVVGDKHGKYNNKKRRRKRRAFTDVQLRRRFLCQYYFDFGCVRTQNDG